MSQKRTSQSVSKKAGFGGLLCCTWFLSSSDPTNHIVDPGHLIIGVDVHAHFPVVDKIGIINYY